MNDQNQLLRALVEEAPTYFAPQYDFEGRKLAWVERANAAIAAQPTDGGEAVEVVPREWRSALRKLVLMARTGGGTAGPDSGLMQACSEAEALLLKPYRYTAPCSKAVAEFDEMRGRPVLLPGAPLLTHKQKLYAAPQASQRLDIEALKSDACLVFDAVNADQSVRDVIEWYHSSLLARATQDAKGGSKCELGCTDECLARMHGSASECPALPWQPVSSACALGDLCPKCPPEQQIKCLAADAFVAADETNAKLASNYHKLVQDLEDPAYRAKLAAEWGYIAAQPAEGGEVCNVKSSAGLIRPGKVDAWVANHYTTPPASQERPAWKKLQAAVKALCECGVKTAADCDEQWGPQCDLGNNPAYVRVAPGNGVRL